MKHINDITDQRLLLVEFLRRNCVIRSGDEPIVSPSGGAARWLVDTRIALLDAAMSEIIGELYWCVLSRIGKFQLCCLEMTGIPLMMAAQAAARNRGVMVNAFIIRKERKPTGRQRRVEGIIDSSPIVFVDDLFNSGSSVRKAIRGLADEGKAISLVVALVDFGRGQTADFLLAAGVNINSVIALSELGLVWDKDSSANVSEARVALQWKFCPDQVKCFDLVPKSTPVVDEDTVYFGRDDGVFYALDAISGSLRWVFKAGKDGRKGIRSSPVLHGDSVYFGAYDGNLYALDKRTGELRWVFSDSDWVGSSPSISLDCGHIFVGLEFSRAGQQGGIVCLDVETGKQIWNYEITNLVHGSPLAVDEFSLVAVGCNGGVMHCLDSRTGERIWHFQAKGAFKSRPAFDSKHDLLLAGSFDGSVYAWHISDGALHWQVVTGGYLYSQPLILDDLVYISSSDKHLYVVRLKNGELVKRIYLGAKLLGNPRENDGYVFVPTSSGKVCLVQAKSLTHAFDIFAGDRMANEVVFGLDNKSLYLCTVDGQLECFSNNICSESEMLQEAAVA